MQLVVAFRHAREPYRHAVQADREARATIDGWKRDGGLWLIDGPTLTRAWVPWHAVDEVRLLGAPDLAVLAGPGRAVAAPPPAPGTGVAA